MSQVIKKRVDLGVEQDRAIMIGVISDSHISSPREELPLGAAEGLKSMDAIIHAGDLVVPDVLDKLKAICPQVIAVYGNMDPQEVKDMLPQKEIVSAGKYKIGVMHGYGNPNALVELAARAFAAEKVDIIIFGHSHNPVNERKNGILYFNPGSLTDKVFAQYNSYGVIKAGDNIEAKIVRI